MCLAQLLTEQTSGLWSTSNCDNCMPQTLGQFMALTSAAVACLLNTSTHHLNFTTTQRPALTQPRAAPGPNIAAHPEQDSN